MSETENWLDQAEFADNPEPRCPAVLLLDASASMRGDPIRRLNAATKELAGDLREDRLASLRVEVAVVAFGGEVRALDVRGGGARSIPFDANDAFVTADQFVPPEVEAGGDTPMGDAVRRALQLLRDRKAIYKQAGLDYFRPWLFVISDGQPTDKGWEGVAEEARAEEERRGVTVFPIGVGEEANMEALARFAKLPPLKLREGSNGFQELFRWVSKSLTAVAQSRPGDQVPLPPVTWAQVDTSH